ncbi:complex I subunit 5 family protein [Aliidiomarina indica]|uniref:complex I subunit 5 family protein n=1 Tax=Aliidiomarina indica TaxID=2749147 RepID=UPI00188F4EC0|nr:proton-conducting transporter membrane subunit [Aliidiomarina indica]
MTPILLIIPLAFAILTLLLPRNWARATIIPGLVLQVGAAVLLCIQIYHDGPQDYALGDWQAPLGISLIADGFSVTLLALTSLVAALCAVYAQYFLTRYPREQRYFWPLFWFLLAALNGIWLAGDLFNLYVGLELLGLSAVGMVALTAEKTTLKAALDYLYAALFGSLAYLAGVALLYGAYGTLSIVQLSEMAAANPTTQVALGLMTVGLLLKTAIFPLHYWLPPAHGGALAPVSALLSALVVKASFYILALLWLDVGALAVTVNAAQAMGFLGAGAIFWGSWQAFQTRQIKMLVAYSTVAQLGYLMLLFPLAIGVSEAAAHLAWQGTVLHLLAHAFAKAAMFLAVGTLVLALGHGRINDFGGVSQRNPVALFAFGLSAVSLMGLPPSGGFNAKWLLLQSAIASGQWHWFVVMVIGGLLTAAYVFRVFRVSFVQTAKHDIQETHPALQFSALALALMAIGLGFASEIPMSFMNLTDFTPSPGGSP